MAKNIRNQVNIASLTVQTGAKGAAQLMRADLLFQRRGQRSIFFDQVFDGALRDPAPLHGQKKRFFMARQWLDGHALLQICLERIRHAFGEIQDRLVAALSRD